MTVPSPPSQRPPGATDPVRAWRQRLAKYVLLANRIGYLMFAAAIAVFVIGFAVGFNNAVSVIVIVCMVIGSILLAPALVMGYGIKAAERDDREHGR